MKKKIGRCLKTEKKRVSRVEVKKRTTKEDERCIFHLMRIKK
jgi:hypothetical protein